MLFFFKQKTAYEMRISDWSSDVCSSDLHCIQLARQGARHRRGADVPGDMVVQRFRVEAEPVIFGRDMIGRMLAYEHHRGSAMLVQYLDGLRPIASACGWLRAHWSIEPFIQRARGVGVEAGHAGEFGRSEEHTSALQSLMRHSYAVLRLKNKHTPTIHV